MNYSLVFVAFCRDLSPFVIYDLTKINRLYLLCNVERVN